MIMESKPRKDAKRKKEILQVAAEVMRTKAVQATRLQDVADQLGVAYTALYHYFPSRDDLVAEVICWSIDQRIEMLGRARGESELDRLLHFFRMTLLEGREMQVRSVERVALAEPHRTRTDKARNKLRNRMMKVIDRGIAEGSIRTCHSLTMANALLDLSERLSFFDQSLFSKSVRAMPLETVVEHVCRILWDGILVSGEPPPRETYQIQDGSFLLGFDGRLTPELQRLDTILAAATRHFNQEGINASIPAMATELGVSKTVLYQYAIDKQDLLFQCYLRGVGVVELSHRIADDFGKGPLDASLIHRRNLYVFHGSSAGPFIFINAMSSLKPQHQRLMGLKNKGVRDISIERMRNTQAAGQMHADVIPDIAQPMLGQILYGLPAWFSNSYPLSIEEVCWQTGLLPFIGLRKRN